MFESRNNTKKIMAGFLQLGLDHAHIVITHERERGESGSLHCGIAAPQGVCPEDGGGLGGGHRRGSIVGRLEVSGGR